MKKIIAVTGLLFLAVTANAATVVYNGELVTGIANLDIGGTLYNVDFGADSGFSTFGGDETYWATQVEAEAASTAINSLILDRVDNASQIYAGEVNEQNNTYYSVHYDAADKNVWNHFHTAAEPAPLGWVMHGAQWTDDQMLTFYGTTAHTAWSVSTVPVPAAVWLFGSALGGLGWMRRRKTV